MYENGMRANELWQGRGSPIGSPWADWFAARRERLAESSYLSWCERGRPPGDDWSDWFEAERSLHDAVETAAYYHWLGRGCPAGTPWVDWAAAEAML